MPAGSAVDPGLIPGKFYASTHQPGRVLTRAASGGKFRKGFKMLNQFASQTLLLIAQLSGGSVSS